MDGRGKSWAALVVFPVVLAALAALAAFATAACGVADRGGEATWAAARLHAALVVRA